MLRDRVSKAGYEDQIVIDSAGTGDWNLGKPADTRAQMTLKDHGYTLDGHISRQINYTWMSDIDLIVVMDSSNFTAVSDMVLHNGHPTTLRMMRSFDPDLAHLLEPHPDLDVPDPYYGSEDGFELVLGMIERASDGLVSQVAARLTSQP